MITVTGHVRRKHDGRLERGALTAGALAALAAIWLGLGFRGLPTALGGSGGKHVETPLVAHIADEAQPHPHAIHLGTATVATPRRVHHRAVRGSQPASVRIEQGSATSREPSSAPATAQPHLVRRTPTVAAEPVAARVPPAETATVSHAAAEPARAPLQQAATTTTATQQAPAPPTTTTSTTPTPPPPDSSGSGLPSLPSLPAVPSVPTPPDLPQVPSLPSPPSLPSTPTVAVPPPVDPTQQLPPVQVPSQTVTVPG